MAQIGGSILANPRVQSVEIEVQQIKADGTLGEHRHLYWHRNILKRWYVNGRRKLKEILHGRSCSK